MSAPIRDRVASIARFPWAATALFAAMLAALTATAEPMRVGADDAGRARAIYDDPSMAAAFQDIGFSFLMFHVWSSTDIRPLDALDRWARERGVGFFINQENADSLPGDPARFRRPGRFFQPSREFVRRCLDSPGFLGICYDEAEHWIMNGIFVTHGKNSMTEFVPHFYDAEGDSLEGAYEGNLHNLRELMRANYPEFARPPKNGSVICTEHVFPALFHLFARAGIAPFPKYLKESVTPVASAMALGAAKQYGISAIPCLDLWGPGAAWPGHTPAELTSALRFAYWTGSPAAYVENISYRDSLYRNRPEGGHELTPWGNAVRDFIRAYMPANPRSIRQQDFSPEILIVRFPDSDWGQTRKGGYIRGDLYGAASIQPDHRTRAWIDVWNLISHGSIPASGLTWHARYSIPYRFFFPANNVAVYDHTAADDALYRHARLIFLCGIAIPPETLQAVRRSTERGAVTVALPWVLGNINAVPKSDSFSETRLGKGHWIIAKDLRSPELRRRLAPLLGRPDELRYVFGGTEVIFRQPDPDAPVQVECRSAR